VRKRELWAAGSFVGDDVQKIEPLIETTDGGSADVVKVRHKKECRCDF